MGVATEGLEAQRRVARPAAGVERRSAPAARVAEQVEGALQVGVEHLQVMHPQEMGLVILLRCSGPAVAAAVRLGHDLVSVGGGRLG